MYFSLARFADLLKQAFLKMAYRGHGYSPYGSGMVDSSDDESTINKAKPVGT